MITVFLKSTVRPWPSVSRPSSRICSSALKTSGWPFSISSNSTTEYGLRPHMLGQLAAFVIADIARRRADHARHGMLLHVLGHIDPDHGLVVVEHELGQSLRQFGLTDARRTQEDEAADGPVGIAQPRAVAADGIRHQRHRFVLPDDALVQPRFHVDQLLHFAFEHARDRNAGPLGHDLRDIFFVDLFFQQSRAGFDRFQIVVGGFEVALDLGQLAVLQLRGLLPVARRGWRALLRRASAPALLSAAARA